MTKSSASPGAIHQAFYLIRGSTLGLTLTLPVVGAATAGPVGLIDALLMLPPAVCFHVFIYVLNDVVDLPVDRTEPRRSQFPLVTGWISPRVALTIALAAVPASLGTAWLTGASASALTVLGLAFAAGAAYDVWGKRAALPPLTDAVQGLAWAGLLAYGAVARGGPTSLTIWLSAYVMALIALVNGLHGSLRDLANDYRCGARTTAIFFGARPQGDRKVTVPAVLMGYAAALQTAVVLTALGAAAAGSGAAATGGAVALLAIASLCLVQAARRSGEPKALHHLGALHVISCLLVLVVLVAGQLSATAAVLLLVVFFGPLAVDAATVSALGWLLRLAWHRRPTVQRVASGGD